MSQREKLHVIRDGPFCISKPVTGGCESALTRLTDIHIERPGFDKLCLATVL